MADGEEKRRLTADGPVLLSDASPRMVERFAKRLCRSCENPIMGHWLIANSDPELATNYWCDKTGTQFSEGLKESV